MKKTLLSILLACSTFHAYATVENPTIVTANDSFTGNVLIDNLESPWEMVWGNDNQIWITERQGKHISTINPTNGEYTKRYTFENTFSAPPHQGLLGMALHPNFLKGKNEDYVYAYYTYRSDETQNASEFGRVVRLRYDAEKQILTEETTILDKLPAGDDHNAGRLIFGKDGKLYLTLGDNGYNQFVNSCNLFCRKICHLLMMLSKAITTTIVARFYDLIQMARFLKIIHALKALKAIFMPTDSVIHKG